MQLARAPHPDDWHPNPGPQTRFLGLTCFEALYGGQAGGGKSDAILVDAVRYVGRGYGRNYAALLLRREFTDLDKGGGLIHRSQDLYRRLGGEYNATGHRWTFPSGEQVYFGHVQHEHDVHRYQGDAYQFVGFDELTTFTESQYLYLISRLRSAHGIPLRLRAGTNPGGVGHDWVFKRFAAWLDPQCPTRVKPAEVAYFKRTSETEEAIVPRGTPGARGRCFVPAALDDNPYLATDGEYSGNLDQLDPVTRARLKFGDWLRKPSRGDYFKRGWFRILDVAPADVRSRCRYWDLAGSKQTEGSTAKKKGDFAVGLKLSRTEAGLFVVEHIARNRGTPGDTRELVKNTIAADGKGLSQYIEQDPGQAGADQIASYVDALAGYIVNGRTKHIDKITAAAPLSSQAQVGNIALVRAPWNEAFLDELEAFPEGDHDDQVDALSGAGAVLFEDQESSGDEILRLFRNA